MADPFQNVSDAGQELIDIMVETLENRGADPQMVPVIDAYLDDLTVAPGARIVEIGAGTGPVSRRIADRFPDASVLGVEPSPELVAEADKRVGGRANLAFAVGSGDRLAEVDGGIDIAVQHTVLSHVPDPAVLVAEAARVLKPGGRLVICDADFSKQSAGAFEDDPLQACFDLFRKTFVTDAFLAAKLPRLIADAGLTLDIFRVANRLTLTGPGVLGPVRMATKYMLDNGMIGEPLAAALVGEYERRDRDGTLYALTPFVTAIATRPRVT
ncbi:methyltransferase domain-containing protein [Acuticoccus sediminis]|uniref:methyltransferase domain-containing protein n=1 Tax=Acuticoccus sediminis TaxID=2184697 RepID=UPI001CFDA6D4|nr:methyltransferase domain-containing protein [Acuticoccus sediminis]